MNKDGILTIINEKGEQKNFYILVTFDIEEKNKSYVIYTDYSKTEDGNLRVFASTYNPYDEDDKLEDIVEKDELEIIDNYLQTLQEDLKSGIKLA